MMMRAFLAACAMAGTALPAAAHDPGARIQFSCAFEHGARDCGFREQAKAPGRTTIVTPGRGGGNAVRLETQPGDTHVAGSGENERTDLLLPQSISDGYEGREHWWAHSVLFPDDYVNPPMGIRGAWHWGAVFGWHHTGSTGQGNFSLFAFPDRAISPDRPTGLVFRICGGMTVIRDALGCQLTRVGKVARNVWYDFVYQVKWSSDADGYINAWMRVGDEKLARRVLSYRGPTLYAGMGAYLKAANYHSPHGLPSAIIHSRIIRGTSPEAVALVPLQGVSRTAHLP
jgi:hypothetical protein